MQLAMVNVTGSLNGTQLGLVNISGDTRGLQVGLVNISNKHSGYQIGLVNISKKMKGVPFGIINIDRDGRVRNVLYTSSLMGVTSGWKFMVNKIYSMFTIGYYNYGDGKTKSISRGFYYGVHLPFNEKYFLDIDLGFLTIDNFPLFSNSGEVKDKYITQSRFIFGYDYSKNLSFTFGLGFNRILDSATMLNKFKPTYFVGIEVF